MSVVHNPIDTAEQRQHELYALELYNSKALREEREKVRKLWLDLVRPSKTMLSCFETAFDEVMFAAVVWALNQDPLRPKVITISRVPHALQGKNIPGSRWGIDNPDSVYRVIPVSGNERYCIHGRVHHKRQVENYFTLWDKNMATVGLLSGKDLLVDDEGRFTITVDRSPADGRPNHIQSCAEAHEFYIRDVIADWKNDRVNELRVERLGPLPDAPPPSRDDDIKLAGEYMHKWANNTARWNNQAMHKAPNDFSFVIDRDTDGGLRNQIYIMGHFKLPSESHVLVLDVDMGGAEYFIAPITNIWGTTNDIIHRNGCLNMSQSVANDAGNYRFVLALRDPGVANWLDPSDMDEGILTLRWAEFIDGQPGQSLGVRSKMMTLGEFQSGLNSSDRITPEKRQRQLAQRAESYQWRLDEELL